MDGEGNVSKSEQSNGGEAVRVDGGEAPAARFGVYAGCDACRLGHFG